MVASRDPWADPRTPRLDPADRSRLSLRTLDPRPRRFARARRLPTPPAPQNRCGGARELAVPNRPDRQGLTPDNWRAPGAPAARLSDPADSPRDPRAGRLRAARPLARVDALMAARAEAQAAALLTGRRLRRELPEFSRTIAGIFALVENMRSGGGRLGPRDIRIGRMGVHSPTRRRRLIAAGVTLPPTRRHRNDNRLYPPPAHPPPERMFRA